MKLIAKAILNVMKSVKGIEKAMTVGSGNFQYKGVSDYEVKKLYKSAMEEQGLCILPISVDAKTEINVWDEEVTYNNKTTIKHKQSVFTEVQTKYLLLHESGESIELAGYGHGVDAQDKGAGKATTYALKYALLYTFLTPTGKIDDADNAHSNEIEIPKKASKTDRGDALTETQYHQLLLPENKQHIKSYMHLRMTTAQKDELTKLMNKK